MPPRADAASEQAHADAHEIIRNEPGLSLDEHLDLLQLVVWPTPTLERLRDVR